MTIRCAQCGAEVELERETSVAACRHCGSSLYVDLSGTRLHTVLEPRLDESSARRLGRVRGRARLVYLPFWRFERGATTRFAPADSRLRESFDAVPPLAGRERSFGSAGAPHKLAEPPNLPLEAVLDPGDPGRASARLVHVPFFEFAGSGDQSPSYVDAVEARLISRADSEAQAEALLDAPRLAALSGLFFAAGLAPGRLGLALGALVAALGFAWLKGRALGTSR